MRFTRGNPVTYRQGERTLEGTVTEIVSELGSMQVLRVERTLVHGEQEAVYLKNSQLELRHSWGKFRSENER